MKPVSGIIPQVRGDNPVPPFYRVVCMDSGRKTEQDAAILEAIRNTGEWKLKGRTFHILWFLLGMEGELAGNSMKVVKKGQGCILTPSLTLACLVLR